MQRRLQSFWHLLFENQHVLVVVHRPRFESLEKRLAKQEASGGWRNAALYVFDEDITDLQRPDNKGAGWRGRTVGKDICLLAGKIGFFDSACSDEGANDIGGHRDIGGTAINDEI